MTQEQGEGGNRNPYYGGDHLSHFYTFGVLYYGRKNVYNAAAQQGDWTCDKVEITDDQYYKMTPVPAGAIRRHRLTFWFATSCLHRRCSNWNRPGPAEVRRRWGGDRIDGRLAG